MQGIVGSGIVIVAIAWCIKMRGPIFASIFNPLQLLLVAISAYLLLNEKLYLGRYIINPTYPKHHMFIIF
jgi:drug/metabolite transporter (DMT)-like permease